MKPNAISFPLVIILISLSGCVGAPIKYSDGSQSIDRVPDSQLVAEAGRLVIEANSINSIEKGTTEIRAILSELEKRHPDWHWKEIHSGKIQVGMNKYEVRLSWGNPTRFNQGGAQWVYARPSYTTGIVFFQNSVMTGFSWAGTIPLRRSRENFLRYQTPHLTRVNTRGL